MTDSTHNLIIGVDGGGTGCRAAIGTLEKGVLGMAEAGAANYASDPALTIQNVLMAVERAADKAGFHTSDLAGACAHLGLAGIMNAANGAAVAASMPFHRVKVTTDRPTAVVGALGGQDGYLLSIGTGIIAAACTEGALRVVNGWGFHVSDQASGAWLGRATLERVLLCHDGIYTHTDVTRQVFETFQSDPKALSVFSVTAKPGAFATFAPAVVQGLSQADPWSVEIMSSGAAYLKRYLAALEFRAGDVLCLNGGLGEHYAQFLETDLLRGRRASCGTALSGAFQLAAKMKETA